MRICPLELGEENQVTAGTKKRPKCQGSKTQHCELGRQTKGTKEAGGRVGFWVPVHIARARPASHPPKHSPHSSRTGQEGARSDLPPPPADPLSSTPQVSSLPCPGEFEPHRVKIGDSTY